MTLRADGVFWERGGAMVLQEVSIHPEPGSTVGVLGPNGSGKSSLLSLLAGVNNPSQGRVLLGERDLSEVPRKQRAAAIGVVSQHADTDLALRVIDVVRLGRIPHRGPFGGDQEADDRAVARALAATGMEHLAERPWQRLSGGERQRAQIARALAQQPTELLLDEPTNHLDIKHQLALLRLVSRLEITAVMALHDLNLAAAYCDQVVVMNKGQVVAAGPPDSVLSVALIEQVYGVRATCALVRGADDRQYVSVTYEH